jgi:hypothetical protein
LAGVVGGVVSGGGITTLLTLIVIVAEGVLLPAASLATAVRVWLPLAREVVLRVVEYGEVVSKEPRLEPSSLNWTLATPTLSEAVAETLTLAPETVALLVGAVIETVGGVVSGGTLLTVIEIAEDVVVLPAESVATAVRL